MSDLTPERLARLRTWATRHRPPGCGPDIGRHLYDGGCPWCRADDVLKPETIDGYTFDGNAHDVALELLDEIERLREIVADLTDPDDCWYDHHGYCQAHGWFETPNETYDGQQGRECPHARAKRGAG